VAPAGRLGKVVEVLDATERYTYARLDACGEEAWVAGPKLDLKVGQVVSMAGGAGMRDFKSKSLDRTFESILFVNDWTLSDSQKIECAAPLPDDVAVGTVVQVEDGGGYTYVEIERCGATQWIAGPQTPVKVGERVGAQKGQVMRDFYSKSFSRTFDELTLVQKFRKAKALPPCE
jgi:hypothetical protein